MHIIHRTRYAFLRRTNIQADRYRDEEIEDSEASFRKTKDSFMIQSRCIRLAVAELLRQSWLGRTGPCSCQASTIVKSFLFFKNSSLFVNARTKEGSFYTLIAIWFLAYLLYGELNQHISL